MKRTAVVCLAAMATTALYAAVLKNPAFRMTETELLAVLRENGLNDKVTACQELSHVGTAAAVPALAGLLADASEPVLFHAARFALENIPGNEAKAALEGAVKTVKDAKRRKGLETSLRSRINPIPEGYVGASDKITALPAKNAIQRGDVSAIPVLVEAAVGIGPKATLAKRNLVGFPNGAVVGEMLKLANGNDMKKARLAVSVLGDRQERGSFEALCRLVRVTKDSTLRDRIFNAFATFCKADDIPALMALLENMADENRLVGAIVHLGLNGFAPDDDVIEIVKAEYGAFDATAKNGKPLVADVSEMVKSLVAGGSSTIVANTRLAGQGGFAHDPAPGHHKTLHLTYRKNGGPAITTITKDTEECELVGKTLDERIAAPILRTYAKAKEMRRHDLMKATETIIDALERRGRVPGADSAMFRPIFNGKDLNGWSQKDGFFSVKNGAIVGESTTEHPCKPNHHLVYTAETFKDFELRGEFRLSRGANSGIQLRCKTQFIGDNGYQADMNGGGNYVGYLYHPRQHLVGERGANVTLADNGAKTVTRFAEGKSLQGIYLLEQWNDIRVKVKGRTITVWINGVRTTSVEDARNEFLPDSGHIALQLHQGPPMTVEFRNLRVR